MSGVPIVGVELDRPRKLRMDFNAIADFEAESGRRLGTLADGGMSFSDMRAFVWACLRHEDEGLTLHDVGSMLHPGNVLAVTEAIKQLTDGIAKND